MDIRRLLESSSLFSNMHPRIQWLIASLAQEKFFEAGDYLIHEGDVGTCCYIIFEGKVEVFQEKDLSSKLPLYEAGKGELLGELALIDGQPRSVSVVALEHTHTFAISEWDFKAQLQAYPEIALQLLPIIAKRLRRTQNILTQLAKNEKNQD